MFCPKCGTEQPEDGKFCPKCGYKINNLRPLIAETNKRQQQQTSGNTAVFSSKDLKKPLIITFSIYFFLMAAAGLLFLQGKNAIKSSSNTNTQVSNNQKPDDTSKVIKDQLVAVITTNIMALEKEDMNLYLDTLNLTDEELKQTKERVQKLFNAYDLDYIIEKQTVLSTYENNAQVEVVTSTSRIKGKEDYKNNKTTVVYHLKLINGTWKIFNTDEKILQYIY